MHGEIMTNISPTSSILSIHTSEASLDNSENNTPRRATLSQRAPDSVGLDNRDHQLFNDASRLAAGLELPVSLMPAPASEAVNSGEAGSNDAIVAESLIGNNVVQSQQQNIFSEASAVANPVEQLNDVGNNLLQATSAYDANAGVNVSQLVEQHVDYLINTIVNIQQSDDPLETKMDYLNIIHNSIIEVTDYLYTEGPDISDRFKREDGNDGSVDPRLHHDASMNDDSVSFDANLDPVISIDNQGISKDARNFAINQANIKYKAEDPLNDQENFNHLNQMDID